MATIDHVTLEVTDPEAADVFHTAFLGPHDWLRVRASDAPAVGFRGFTLSLVVPVPADVDKLVAAAVAAGGKALKPAAKSLWGYGGVVRDPDGVIWTVASATKKDAGPATGRIDDVVLQLGVTDVGASKRFHVGRGLEVTRSYGRRYAEFAPPGSPVKLALLKRRALAKAAGVDPEGSGSHRLAIGSDAGAFTDPDGFVWEPA
jgi:catechol 2,3-dioxygenase-like lactoylglutathione lyase family enzyme